MHLSDNNPVQSPKQEGDRNAEFTKFMRTYQNMVFSTAARLSGNDAHAEDIAQEVFLRAHRKFDELRDNPRAAGWLKTVATNLTFTHLKRHTVHHGPTLGSVTNPLYNVPRGEHRRRNVEAFGMCHGAPFYRACRGLSLE